MPPNRPRARTYVKPGHTHLRDRPPRSEPLEMPHDQDPGRISLRRGQRVRWQVDVDAGLWGCCGACIAPRRISVTVPLCHASPPAIHAPPPSSQAWIRSSLPWDLCLGCLPSPPPPSSLYHAPMCPLTVPLPPCFPHPAPSHPTHPPAQPSAPAFVVDHVGLGRSRCHATPVQSASH